MESDSDTDIEGVLTVKAGADWGKAKHDYYYTDYVDKDYPSKLTAKEERLAAIEQEEALRIQKKLLSTLDNVIDIDTVFEDDDDKQVQEHENLIDILERQNRSLESLATTKSDKSKKRKRVSFEDQKDDEKRADYYDGEDDEDEEYDDEDGDDNDSEDEEDDGDDDAASPGVVEKDDGGGRRRRPINIAMKKNRGLTPYKKKEYRNPRVKHKLKYKKAMSKRRRIVKERQTEYHRYSGETSGIKTSTIKSIKLC